MTKRRAACDLRLAGRTRDAIQVTAANSKGRVADLRWLRSRLGEVARELALRQPELSFVIVDDARMAALHERYRGVKGTTDVLTFDLKSQISNLKSQISNLKSPHGEVYLCLDEARRRAAELGHAPRLELLLYAVHGLLHLLGCDDHTEAGYRRMHRKEDQLLREIGVGAVFSTRSRGNR